MLTDAAGGVDGLWIPISELARRKGVSKQAISKRVARFCEQQLLQTRTGDRGSVLVNLAEYDKAADETTDFARASGGQPKKPAEEPPMLDSFTKAQAEQKRYQAEMARLDLELRLKKILPIADVEAAMVRVAEVLVRQTDRLPARTDDPAIRKILKEFAHDLRTSIAAEMARLFDEGREQERDAAQADIIDGDED